MAKKLNWNGHSGKVIDSKNGYDVIECDICKFKHIVPIPSPEELDSLYREEYYSTEKPLYIEHYRQDLDWWNLVYEERYNKFEKLLPQNRRRILDVGSGPGFFLLHGKTRGWHVLGIEPSAQAATHSRQLGLDIIHDFLTCNTAKKLGSFDVINMGEVLEHIPDPKGILKIAKQSLSPGGLICLVVPNDYNPIQNALINTCGYDPWWVVPPHHINYFNFDSLEELVRDIGFKPILREATFPIDLFLLMGVNYIGNNNLGRECHNRRMTLERNLVSSGLANMKRELYQTLARSGIGREAVIIGLKQES